MASQNNIQKPVTILTGFLGAGKTTFLNDYIAYKKNTRFAIVENEIGEEGIDGDLVLQTQDTFIEMNNGCLCCSLNDNFYEILEELSEKNELWNELIIEATGIADPAGIAFPFLASPRIESIFKLERIVCMVDAELVEDQLMQTEEARKQIAFSDIILINKTDLVRPEYVKDLSSKLISFNPMAKIMIGQKGQFPLKNISAYLREKTEEELAVAKKAHSQDHHHEKGVENGHDHHHSHSHSDIKAISFRYTEPFNEKDISSRLNIFLLFQAGNIYRMKGIFYDPTYSHKIILQSVGKTLLITRGTPWKEGEEKISRFVFIGKNLVAKGYEKMLRDCIRKPSKSN